MASDLYSVSNLEKPVVSRIVLPREESFLSDHPGLNSKFLEFHSTLICLPPSFKGTRANERLGKDCYKKNRKHDEEVKKKVVEEQENTPQYERSLKLGGAQ